MENLHSFAYMLHCLFLPDLNRPGFYDDTEMGKNKRNGEGEDRRDQMYGDDPNAYGRVSPFPF